MKLPWLVKIRDKISTRGNRIKIIMPVFKTKMKLLNLQSRIKKIQRIYISQGYFEEKQEKSLKKFNIYGYLVKI